MRRCAPVVMALAVAAGLSGAAEAHVLRTDGTASVLMHIEPYDHPEAGTPVTIEMYLSSATNDLSLSDCNCIATLAQNDKTIKTYRLSDAYAGAGNTGTIIVTFPHIGVYDLSLKGTSKTGAFTDFTVDYPVRVATQAPGTGDMRKTVIGLSLAGGVALVTIGTIAWQFGRKRKRKTRKKS